MSLLLYVTHLKINAALQILLQPQSVAVVCGHNLRLSCHAMGKSPVQYQWFKSKEEVICNPLIHTQKHTISLTLFHILLIASLTVRYAH